MSKEITEQNTLIEVLAKTSYQIQITAPADKDLNKPIAFGSGFFIIYKKKIFFVTADHNIHIEDHNKNVRTGVDNVVAILNNIHNKEDFSTLLTPIGGFYFMEKFDFTKPSSDPELFDVAVSILTPDNLKAPFLTENLLDGSGAFLVKEGEGKFQFTEDQLIEANKDDLYFVFGKIKPRINGLVLHREDTLKEDLIFVSESGDYLLFNCSSEISNYEDWAGLSGSPVLNQEGNCVGVLCAVNVGSKSLWVKPINKIKSLMDVAIQQEDFS